MKRSSRATVKALRKLAKRNAELAVELAQAKVEIVDVRQIAADLQERVVNDETYRQRKRDEINATLKELREELDEMKGRLMRKLSEEKNGR